MSNAERQKRYRDRARSSDDDRILGRISSMVSVAAECQLKRLAKHYEISKRAMLEKLLQEHEDCVLDVITPEQAKEYFK